MIRIEVENTEEKTVSIIELSSSKLTNAGLTIGRISDADIVLSNYSISRKHAEIVMLENRLSLVDVGSTSGTVLNGSPIAKNEKMQIDLDSVVSIGPYLLTLKEIEITNIEEDEDLTQLAAPIPSTFQPVAYVREGDWNIWDNSRIKVTCANIFNETKDVKTFTFIAEPNMLFRYMPGQFAMLHLDIEGKAVNRSYTISSTPSRPHTISCTVKRVPAAKGYAPGLVSNWLHDNLNTGDSIEISGPYGDFSSHIHSSNKLCFISGGSGITPMLSMTRWLCDTGANVDIVFVHVAKTEADIVARNELEMISEKYPNVHLLFTVTRDNGNSRWSGLRGRLSADMLNLAVPDYKMRRVFVCGPVPFMAAVKNQLLEQGFPMDRYQEESFGGPGVASGKQTKEAGKEDIPEFGIKAIIKRVAPSKDGGGAPSPVRKSAISTKSAEQSDVTFNKSGITVSGNDQSILDLAELGGLSLAFGCRAGSCGACKQILVRGKLDTDGYCDDVLSDAEKKAGYILCCIAKADGDVEIEA